MSNPVLPASNLPPLSVPWGRRLENFNVSDEVGISALEAVVASQNRNNATNVAALGRRISELQNRSSYFTTIPLSTTTANMPVQLNLYPYQGSVSFSVPPPDDGQRRMSLIFLSCYAYNDAPAGSISGVTSIVLTSDDMDKNLSAAPMANPAQGSVPPNWLTTSYLFGSIVPTGASLNLAYGGTVSRNGATPTSVQIGVRDVNVTVIYGEVVQ